MAADLIGVGRCPIGCGNTKARYTLSKKNLAVGTCNACNTQVFARSDRSDEVLRANINREAGAASPEAVEPPKPTPAPTPAPIVEKPPQQPAKRVHTWGILAGREA